jgi:hypothetical protein
LRLGCWNAEEIRGRKLELEHFLSKHGVDICLLIETFLNSGQAFRLANYVCHRADRLTAGGCTNILIRLVNVHHSVAVPALTHLDSTAILIILAGRPVLILAAYFSPSRPLIGADLTACFDGFTVLDGRGSQRQTRGLELPATTRLGKLLRDYADGNSCLIYGPDAPTTNSYNPVATPDVLDMVITK